MGSQARILAIQEVLSRQIRQIQQPKDETGRPLKVSDYFGVNTFGKRQMRDKLPKEVFQRLLKTIERGETLNRDDANAVAHAVKEWALEEGVTHFCHWFQPQTGATAEKHDAFFSFDERMEPVERFSGGQLIQSEPDASSFPSGGMRTTFEARGYTAWDPSSPMFIMESTNGKTLCIPSVFISYHGDALDEKTHLLKSMDVLSEKACELLSLIGHREVHRVIPTLGAEQEYFLIDHAFYCARPDLVMTGRTLLGAQPPKGQQLEDHYFGTIPSRVQSFMNELELELYKLGVPIKTRHNEVAPCQFEAAPIFEEIHIATDHNQLAKDMIGKVAKRHNFVALLHEKPFAQLNGSGKHCNWSLMVSSSDEKSNGQNLLDPGKTPHENVRFLLFLVAVLNGVHRHAGLLRAGIASAGNDHRLGANEAPPAIISVFLGETLTRILDQVEGVSSVKAKSVEEAVIELGVNRLPGVLKDNTDRNRTSPFAFTGNKFEFRAVGSAATAAFPVTLLNAAVADGIEELTQLIQTKTTAGKSQDEAILDSMREVIKKTKAVRFEGNNYSDEWIKEAESRGLLNLRKTPESLAQLVSSTAVSVLTRLGVFTEGELTSRFNIKVEEYIKKILIEVETLVSIVETQVLPATFKYHLDLCSGVDRAQAAGVVAPQKETLGEVSSLISQLQVNTSKLRAALKKANQAKDHFEIAKELSAEVSEVMEAVRGVADQLELKVDDEYWPLPKYREMLFIS